MRTLIPPPAMVVLFGLFMWAIDRLWPTLRLDFAGRGALAVVLLFAALAIMAAAAWTMHRERTTVNPMRPERVSRLVTHGLFRFSRNPIYVADLVVLVAWALWLGQWAALALLPLFVIVMSRWQIAAEEEALARRFGAEYEAYRARVRRWL